MGILLWRKYIKINGLSLRLRNKLKIAKKINPKAHKEQSTLPNLATKAPPPPLLLGPHFCPQPRPILPTRDPEWLEHNLDPFAPFGNGFSFYVICIESEKLPNSHTFATFSWRLQIHRYC